MIAPIVQIHVESDVGKNNSQKLVSENLTVYCYTWNSVACFN